jgi:23S rRNA pseudouridine1911/1915/1917 synthase
LSISEHIIFQNHHFVVANKPAGMPVQADPTNDLPFITLIEQYCKVPLFLINRIDRPVSGLVLFAKTKADAAALSEQFRERTAAKAYIAAVKTAPSPPAAELVHFLKKGKKDSNASTAFAEQQPNTEKAVLHYTTIGSSTAYTFLEIDLQTGRHHQIRAQLAAIGSPVKGDVKYGARRANADRSIHLHAWRISITNPKTNERMTFTAPFPADDAVWAAVGEMVIF